jgi:hypothetical protein
MRTVLDVGVIRTMPNLARTAGAATAGEPIPGLLPS